MLNRRILINAVLLLMLSPLAMLGDWLKFGAIELKCIGDHLYYVSWWAWDDGAHNDIMVDMGENGGCKCQNSKATQQIKSHDAIDDGPCYTCGILAPVDKDSGLPAAWESPTPFGQVSSESAKPSAAAPAGTNAFAKSVPFRQFAIPPLYAPSPPHPPFRFNATPS